MQGNRKLGFGQVQDIRTRYEGGATQGQLAREYNISVVQIGRIVRGEVWQEAGGSTQTKQQSPARMATKEELLAAQERLLAIAKSVHPDQLPANQEPEGKPLSFEEMFGKDNENE